MEKSNPHTPALLKVEGLQKYFPVRRGFLQKVIGWVKAVDGVEKRVSEVLAAVQLHDHDTRGGHR